MEGLRWDYRPDGLRSPAVICALRGGSDAADVASSAITYVVRALRAGRFATVDPEEFFDFQNARPRIKLSEGRPPAIVWPEIALFEARVPGAPRDLLMLTGAEPSLRWRTFSGMIVDLAEALSADLFVTLGAKPAEVPHTRPVLVTGSATDPEVAARLGLGPSLYEGPTGITGILQAICQERSLASATLWASVPHYLATTPNPKAALALIRKLEGLVGVAVFAPGLESAAADYERQVDLAVESNPHVAAYVERLEEAADGEPREDEGALPSGEAIALDLQRFLSQLGGDEPQPPGA
jgi:proteasome assembly chaperone (PAC2) family protein